MTSRRKSANLAVKRARSGSNNTKAARRTRNSAHTISTAAITAPVSHDPHLRPNNTSQATRSPRPSQSPPHEDPHSRDDSDEEVEELQRFSNTSAHPRRSHKVYHNNNNNNNNNNDSPPQLSTTPPPSPPRAIDDAELEARAAVQGEPGQRSVYVSTERGFYVRVSPPAASSERKTSVSPSPPPPPSAPPTPSVLLSELLLAEAERAEAAANAAANSMDVPLFGLHDGLSTSVHTHPVVEHASRLLHHAPLGLTEGRPRSRPLSPSHSHTEVLAPLAVHIGVVPLPGASNTYSTATSPSSPVAGEGPAVLPWVRALHAAAVASKANATSSTKRSRSKTGTPVVEFCGPTKLAFTSSDSAADEDQQGSKWQAVETEMLRSNVRFLRPRRLRTHSQTSVSNDADHAHNAPSLNASTAGGNAGDASTAMMTTTTSEVVGWSGLLPGVQLVLRGAQPPMAVDEKEGKGVDGLPADAQVCVGAATVMVMLA